MGINTIRRAIELGQTKISYLENTITIDKQIIWFQVLRKKIKMLLKTEYLFIYIKKIKGVENDSGDPVLCTLCKIQLIWRYSKPCNVINRYALILAGVNTMLLSLIITSRSVSMKSNTSDTLDLCPNTSVTDQTQSNVMCKICIQ
jgi:hypothetical protein